MNIQTVAKINDVDIVVIENEGKYVPIKPICELLGVDTKSQRTKIKNDEILGSVGVLSTSTGKDGKEYEMFSIPYMFVFGWLFSINSKNVSDKAKDAVIKYKLECYKALYHHFTAHSEFLEEKQLLIENKRGQIQEYKSDFSQAKQKLSSAEKEMKGILELNFDDWSAEKKQLKMFGIAS